MLFLLYRLDEHFILLCGYFITTGLQFIATFRTELHSPVQAKTDANLIAIKMQSIQVKVVTPPLTYAKELILVKTSWRRSENSTRNSQLSLDLYMFRLSTEELKLQQVQNMFCKRNANYNLP